MAAISMHGLVKDYGGGVRAVDDLDLEIEDGSFFALLGPSGCGKTTLLRTIAGLETATSGRIDIGGRDVTNVPPGDRHVAMVFQDYALFPHMSVVDNIAYPLRIQKVPREQRQQTATEVGDGLSLQGLMERRPAQLSGGQQQRVALARAVASRPELFLFDEPLSNLDARLRLEARTFLKRLQADLGVTTVFVTHDQAEALALADQIAIMEHGKIRQVGSPRTIFRRPANTFVAGFVGSTPMNLRPAVVRDGRLALADAVIGLPPETVPVVTDGQDVMWGARPEFLDWSTSDAENTVPGTVRILEHLGAAVLVTVEIGAGSHAGEREPAGGATGSDPVTLQLVVDDDAAPTIGAAGWVVIQPRRTLLFDSDGELIEDPAAVDASEAATATAR